ncbi:MAG: cardiolipin synthase [Defluviitaleaceae bacterium]|nr:cardiolipin synthase [Defluviitaleaceae bacterium]
MTWFKKHRKWLIIPIALAVIAFLVIIAFDFFAIGDVLGDIELPIPVTAVIFLLLYAVQGAVMVVSTVMLYVGAGLLFPTVIGIAVTYAGLTVSLSVGYFIGKKLGDKKVKKMLSKNKKISDFLLGSKDNLVFLCFISRILPTPFGLVSLFFGAMKVPYYKYIFMSLLGLTPFMLPVLFAGAAITNPLSPEFLVPFSVSLGVALIILVAYKTKIVTKTSVAVALIIAQALLITHVLNRIIDVFPFIALAGYLAGIFIVLLLVKRDETASYKMVWIIVVVTIPIGGAILYLVFGNNLTTRRMASHVKEHALVAKLLDSDSIPQHVQLKDNYKMTGLTQYIQRASSYHPYGNTKTTYYPFGEQMFEDMLAELRKAKKFIFMEYFIISNKSQMWAEVHDILLEKAAAGVDIRLIFDDIGSLGLFNSQYVTYLRSKGIKVMRFNPIVPFISPFMNNRNHRKILVIDGHTGFNGGINIDDQYINLNDFLGKWKDTGIRLKGEAVWSFTLMFIETWNTFSRKENTRITDYMQYRGVETDQPHDGIVCPYGDTPLGTERLGENIYIDILAKAQRYVYIFSPYLIISEKMIYALQMAAKRGVDVRIVTPGTPDKWIVHRLTRSYYRYLINVGVRIYEYTPGFLHAKSFVCDDEIAVVGSINLDYRSLYLHFECATLLYEVDVIKDIKADAIATIDESREIVLGKRRMFFHELFDGVLHLVAPLM